MSWYSHATDNPIYHSLPKVDLHRHLEGSLRYETLEEISKTHGITLPLRPDLRKLVQMQDDDPLNFATFLSKFQTLRLFYRSQEVIERVTYEAVEDAALDNVRYLELRFTPVALSRAQAYALGKVMDWVLSAAEQAGRDHHIDVRLIASVNRNEDPALAAEVAHEAIKRHERGIVALDLAGNEAEYPMLPFVPVFYRSQQAGLGITIHAGEWGGAENVRFAIQEMKANRIAHGVRVMEDPAVVQLAQQSGIPFEVCITSNYQSGVVASLVDHSFSRMLAAGLNVTLNTDDPGISQITLSDEYQLAVEDLGISMPVLLERVLAAAEASFLPTEDKSRLVQTLRTEWQSLI
jgi:adenosine deaminase